MKITNSTKTVEVAPITTIGQFKAMLTKHGKMAENDIQAIISIGSGVKVINALRENDLYDKKASGPSNHGNFRSRLSNAMLALARNVMEPIYTALSEERKTETEAQHQIELAEKIVAWEKNGRLGRRPGGVNSSASAVNTSYREAIQETRKKMKLENRGKIPFTLAHEFNETIINIFTDKLNKLAKTTNLHDTIENLVNSFVKPVDEDSLHNAVINQAILTAVKTAGQKAREIIGTGTVGRISTEKVPDYNREVKSLFKDELRKIKDEHGSLPHSMDDLLTEHLTLYEIVESASDEPKAKGKDKGNKKDKATKKPKGGKKAQDETKPVKGTVESDENDANAEVAEAVAIA